MIVYQNHKNNFYIKYINIYVNKYFLELLGYNFIGSIPNTAVIITRLGKYWSELHSENILPIYQY